MFELSRKMFVINEHMPLVKDYKVYTMTHTKPRRHNRNIKILRKIITYYKEWSGTSLLLPILDGERVLSILNTISEVIRSLSVCPHRKPITNWREQTLSWQTENQSAKRLSRLKQLNQSRRNADR